MTSAVGQEGGGGLGGAGGAENNENRRCCCGWRWDFWAKRAPIGVGPGCVEAGAGPMGRGKRPINPSLSVATLLCVCFSIIDDIWMAAGYHHLVLVLLLADDPI